MLVKKKVVLPPLASKTFVKGLRTIEEQFLYVQCNYEMAFVKWTFSGAVPTCEVGLTWHGAEDANWRFLGTPKVLLLAIVPTATYWKHTFSFQAVNICSTCRWAPIVGALELLIGSPPCKLISTEPVAASQSIFWWCSSMQWIRWTNWYCPMTWLRPLVIVSKMYGVGGFARTTWLCHPMAIKMF